ncbi:ubiquitin-like modifier-activating enzyme 7 isoform X2 [Meleagris gallopavo]|uniref:ubiquitin-like modifier-activating enzyme 7 isoform X2 n=1 Tax=Meleagris gallopavo TaxID=9103 RepID=UPI000549AD23|nr:ubiquitin-like modifier-activating enzyme 7 isoform X2 [Meleagris gallopavo]
MAGASAALPAAGADGGQPCQVLGPHPALGPQPGSQNPRGPQAQEEAIVWGWTARQWGFYRGKEWSCWDRLEVRAIGEDGQAMTVRELLAWLQEEHRWTVTKLLRGSTMLYDGEEDEETRARQQAQRLSDGVERSAEPQQLELQYVCAGDELEDACPPLLCTLP